MADDSDDDKPLLFQFKNSKGSFRAKSSARHGASSSLQKSQEKPSKVFQVDDDDKSQNSTVNALQEFGLSSDKSPSPHEPLANCLAARVGTHKPGQVKVYSKRKKLPVDEDVAAKKLKPSSSFAGAAYTDKNGGVDVDGSGCRERDRNAGAIDNGEDQDADCGGRDYDDVNGDTQIESGPKIKMLTNDRGTPIDDPRLSCGVGHMNSLSSKAAARIDLVKAEEDDDHVPLRRPSCTKKSKELGMKDRSLSAEKKAVKKDGYNTLIKEEEDDDHLTLSKMSQPKKNKGSAMYDKELSAKHAVKEEGCEILLKEGEEDDHLPLNKMLRLRKTKESAMDDKKVSVKSAVKEDGYDATLGKDQDIQEKLQSDATSAKVSKVSCLMSENKAAMSANKQKDCIEIKQSHCLSKEEEGDDHLFLSQMARSKKRKSPLGTQMPVGKDAGKKEGESRKFSDDILREKKFSEERVSPTSDQASEEKIDNSIPNGCDVSQCSPLRIKLEKITGVIQDVSGKGTDTTAGLVCKSRAKQLLALSKSLRDIDSEEEEEREEQEQQEEKDDDSEDEDDDDEQEDDDEDADENEDYIGSKVKVVKSPAVKSKRRTNVLSTALNGRASNQSRTRTPMPPSKSTKKISVNEESEEEEEEEEEGEEEEEEDYSEEEDEEEDDEDEEYSVLRGIKRRKTVTVRATETSTGSIRKSSKKIVNENQARTSVKKMKDVPGAGGGQKWTTLEHNGVIFPPFYQPHGIKMLYEGKPVDLTPEQEEVATMFAVMKETDYASKPKFLANFWNDWKEVLGPNHVIQKLEDCDFTPIYEWNQAEKEKKKQLSSQEKKAIKEERLKQEEKYMWAVVDGVKEKVGNFRVEPPGLFRGRGEHPKMGKLKRRIYPEDIVINIGGKSPAPECPLPGHRWKEVRHDDTVTWLAYWNDPINTKEQKYVFLAASSTLKGQSDKEKYEKARVLKDYIEDIRKTYTENFTSSDPTARQIAVATYLIDRLALRAGNEKDDDEADTVGCCSLKLEHVSLIPPSSLQFDFLGKDSIRYFNVVEVVRPVYEAVGDFRKDKAMGSDLFDRLDTNKLNAHLKNIMPQLTAKVFRTYNASITLDTLLVDTDGHLLAERIAAYQRANKEVAILCNHQRSVSKSHGAQMERLEAKLAELNDLVDELEKDLERARKGKPPLKDADGNPKKHQNPDVLERKIEQTKQKMERMKLDMTIKEDLKTVALGTSKINYMDPRITVAWCKKHEVPIEKIFNKSLLAKFAWAMDVDMSFRF